MDNKTMDQKLKSTEQKAETPIETSKDDGKKKLKKTKSDISDVPPTEVESVKTPAPDASKSQIKSVETKPIEDITKQQEPTEKPMSDFEKRRAEMQARRDAKQKELDAIKQGKNLRPFHRTR
jgi:hypothetical protein